MSAIVHSIKVQVNVVTTIFKQGEGTVTFNEVLMALLIAGVSSSPCCRTAECLKRWCSA